VALAAVLQDGLALQHCAPPLRADVDTVLVAVQGCGGALQYASEELRADRHIVRAAVSQDAPALQHAAPAIREEYRQAALQASQARPTRVPAGVAARRQRAGAQGSMLTAATLSRSTVVFTLGHEEEAATARGQEAEDAAAEECMVCLETLQKGDELRVLPCLHRFHRSCIDSWLARKAICPICKHLLRNG